LSRIKTLEDGTRVYSNGTRYKPVADEDRVNKKHKPPVEGAFRVGDRWYLPLPLLPDEARSLPATRPYSKRARSAAPPRS